MNQYYETVEYTTVYGSTVQISDEAKTRVWFEVIEDGVPEDVSMVMLENEATAPDAPKEYRKSWKIACRDVTSATGGLTLTECISIRIYTMNRFKFYKKFNEDCRNENWTPYKVLTSLLHTGLNKLRTDPSSYSPTLYRGMSNVSLSSTPNQFFMPGFTSTSESRSKAKQFGDRIVKFVSSKAAKVEQFSAYPGEQEALFSPFQCFVCKLDKTASKVSKPMAIVETCADKTLPFQTFPIFRGALLGALVGNCIGSPFEFQAASTIAKLIESVNYLEKNTESRGICRYTADIGMTFALADSLTRVGRFDINDLKQSLANAFLADPSRDYGKYAASVLLELNEPIPIGGNPFAPAMKLFGGTGSHGNGGASRITPLALLLWNAQDFNDQVKESTRLTHSNESGLTGAVLQASAVRLALEFSVYTRTRRHDVDIRQHYVDRLQEMMQPLESPAGNGPYCAKLTRIKRYLESPPSTETIIFELGTENTAYNSVPTAIYCFLHGMLPIPEIPAERTGYERTVIYAISLGGDTDTIASMAGAIAGAYYGQDSIPHRWRNICEAKGLQDAKRYAKQIHNLVWK